MAPVAKRIFVLSSQQELHTRTYLVIQYSNCTISPTKDLANVFRRKEHIFILYQFTGFGNPKEIELFDHYFTFEFLRDYRKPLFQPPDCDLTMSYSNHVEAYCEHQETCHGGMGQKIGGSCYVSHHSQSTSWNEASQWCRYLSVEISLFFKRMVIALV